MVEFGSIGKQYYARFSTFLSQWNTQTTMPGNLQATAANSDNCPNSSDVTSIEEPSISREVDVHDIMVTDTASTETMGNLTGTETNTGTQTDTQGTAVGTSGGAANSLSGPTAAESPMSFTSATNLESRVVTEETAEQFSDSDPQTQPVVTTVTSVGSEQNATVNDTVMVSIPCLLPRETRGTQKGHVLDADEEKADEEKDNRSVPTQVEFGTSSTISGIGVSPLLKSREEATADLEGGSKTDDGDTSELTKRLNCLRAPQKTTDERMDSLEKRLKGLRVQPTAGSQSKGKSSGDESENSEERLDRLRQRLSRLDGDWDPAVVHGRLLQPPPNIRFPPVDLEQKNDSSADYFTATSEGMPTPAQDPPGTLSSKLPQSTRRRARPPPKSPTPSSDSSSKSTNTPPPKSTKPSSDPPGSPTPSSDSSRASTTTPGSPEPSSSTTTPRSPTPSWNSSSSSTTLPPESPEPSSSSGSQTLYPESIEVSTISTRVSTATEPPLRGNSRPIRRLHFGQQPTPVSPTTILPDVLPIPQSWIEMEQFDRELGIDRPPTDLIFSHREHSNFPMPYCDAVEVCFRYLREVTNNELPKWVYDNQKGLGYQPKSYREGAVSSTFVLALFATRDGIGGNETRTDSLNSMYLETIDGDYSRAEYDEFFKCWLYFAKYGLNDEERRTLIGGLGGLTFRTVKQSTAFVKQARMKEKLWSSEYISENLHNSFATTLKGMCKGHFLPYALVFDRFLCISQKVFEKKKVKHYLTAGQHIRTFASNDEKRLYDENAVSAMMSQLPSALRGESRGFVHMTH